MNYSMMVRTKDNNIIEIIIEISNERVYVMCFNNLFFIVVGRLYLCSEGKYHNLKTQKIRELYVIEFISNN